MTRTDAVCPVCGAEEWRDLPDPGPRSMRSDWHIAQQPLGRAMCTTCGLARRWPDSEARQFFGSDDYQPKSAGRAWEDTRQDQYAAWIARVVADAPSRVLDVGCGDGGLLRSLATVWPHTRLTGCDLSSAAIAHGIDAGGRIHVGGAEDLTAAEASPLVTSINVIEHTSDPLRFLDGLRRALAADGTLIVVCPDGAHPNGELLIADHLFSFSGDHLRMLCRRVGLSVHSHVTAPQPIGPFQMVVATHGGADGGAAPGASVEIAFLQRSRYLRDWEQLDRWFASRVTTPAVCFGAGEAAALLRAYAPDTWRHFRACVVDRDPPGSMFFDLPVLPLAEIEDHETVVVGVRPDRQESVAQRLRARFPRVITWYECLSTD